jgi:hypothetical protein
MDGERLAVKLSSRIEEAVPEGVTVAVDGDVLWFLVDGRRCAGSYACQWLKSGQDSIEGLRAHATSDCALMV